MILGSFSVRPLVVLHDKRESGWAEGKIEMLHCATPNWVIVWLSKLYNIEKAFVVQILYNKSNHSNKNIAWEILIKSDFINIKIIIYN